MTTTTTATRTEHKHKYVWKRPIRGCLWRLVWIERPHRHEIPLKVLLTELIQTLFSACCSRTGDQLADKGPCPTDQWPEQIPGNPPPPPPLTAHTPGSINCCISCITTWVVFAGHTCVTWKGSYRHVLYGFLSRVAWFKWFTSDVKITSRWFSIESPYGVGRWVLVLVLEMNLESWIKRELPQIAFMVIYYKGNLCFSH